jgi:hypothetical protein
MRYNNLGLLFKQIRSEMLHCFEDCESLFLNVKIMEFCSLQTGAHKGNWDLIPFLILLGKHSYKG